MSHFEFATWQQGVHGVYVRVHGQANMNNSHLFKALIERLLEQQYRLFVIDLAACTSMDSTFMGVLVGIGLFEVEPGALRPRALLVNVGDHCARQLRCLGLHNLLQVREATLDIPTDLALERLEERQFDPIRRVRMIEEAHRNLIRANASNAAVFGPLLETLAAELASQGNG